MPGWWRTKPAPDEAATAPAISPDILRIRHAETVKDVQRSRDALALAQAQTLEALATAYMHGGRREHMSELAYAVGGLTSCRESLERDTVRLRALS